ncbi:streptogrisin C [Saccharothrix longispora]|uniref:Streptogrisin C n=1 Tax=Saccharothrix longispora TaxID=33920 RepID=A0ABU1PNF2_9PSEU|nr:streptogrisin C [Saccharothrix longispora]
MHSWYVDPPTNSVVVNARTTEAARAFAAKAGVTARAEVTEAPRPVHDIRGGDQYVINGNTLCSVGFSVNNGGFVTAGHCGGTGSPALGFNNVGQGTFAGSQEAGVGASVCRSGRTTGRRCGTIQAKNVTVNYSGRLVHGLTSTTACAQPGDSGGSYLAGNQAQGVASGAAGTCANGGTSLFQPVNEILNVYGLQLTTTGGGGSTSRIIGYQDKCIDVPNANGVEGQRLQVWDCNGTNAQNWTFPGDGTVRAFGLCMDVAWGSRDNGAAIQLARCSGNPAQQWECLGSANQKWRRG